MNSDDSIALRRELAAAETREDIQERIEICRRAMTAELDSDPKNLWFFGIKLAACLLAEQEDPSEKDFDDAMQVMTRMLKVFTREEQPGYWARLHLQLGLAIARRKGDPREALMHYENALKVFTKEKRPEEWALSKKAAGEIYYDLADSNFGLEKSLEYHRDALTVFTFEKYPDEGLVEMISTIENLLSRVKPHST